MPVLGSGHPQADVFLLKHAPMPSEIEEGVAFYGRAGTALMKAFKRLGIDPLAVYGTLCVKCPVGDPSLADPGCVARVVEELAIVQPRIVVVMGEDALTVLNDLDVPLAKPVQATPGEVQQLTPSIDALVRPEHRRVRSTRRPPSAPSGRRSGCWASGTRTCRRTDGARCAAAAWHRTSSSPQLPARRSRDGRRPRGLVAVRGRLGAGRRRRRRRAPPLADAALRRPAGPAAVRRWSPAR